MFYFLNLAAHQLEAGGGAVNSLESYILRLTPTSPPLPHASSVHTALTASFLGPPPARVPWILPLPGASLPKPSAPSPPAAPSQAECAPSAARGEYNLV